MMNKIASTKIFKFPKSRSDAKKMIKTLEKLYRLGYDNVVVPFGHNYFLCTSSDDYSMFHIANYVFDGADTRNKSMHKLIMYLNARIFLNKPFSVHYYVLHNIKLPITIGDKRWRH